MSFEPSLIDEDEEGRGGGFKEFSLALWSAVEDAARKSGREVSDYLDETQDAAPLADRSHSPTDKGGAV